MKHTKYPIASITILYITCLLLGSCTLKIGNKLHTELYNIENIKIAEDSLGYGPCEPSICIDPTNPDNILAASILDRIHLSTDGGRTWKNSTLNSSVGVYGDPVVRISNEGIYYFSHLSNPSGKAYQSEDFLDRIQVQKSTNKGITWNDGSAPLNDRKKDQDKQWLYIDPVTNEILMSWTEFDEYGNKEKINCSRILFSKSIDNGNTWSPPIAISNIEGDCVDDDFTTEGAVPAMDSHGNIFVSWAHGNNIYMDISKDGGKTWMDTDLIVSDIIGGWSISVPGIGRCNGMPVLAIDRSGGKHNGNLYINWSDQRNGENNTDIWITRSSDRGKTWSIPKRVNNDDTESHQFFSWMDVDDITGFIYIVYYDRRNHTDANTDVYLSYSTDGGSTFQDIKISNSSFIPNEDVFFGDYNDISAYNNIIRPIWTRYENYKLSVWTATINF